MKLTKEERRVEEELLRDEWVPAPRAEFERVQSMIARTAAELARRKKDAVLNIRINSGDLTGIKRKAAKLKVPYQALIAELLHLYAQ